MKAPDKIFLERVLCSNEVYDEWKPQKTVSDDIEYVRKDAFIEKARKWFELQNEWRDINGIKHCDMDGFEDFKKYVEQ